MQEFAAVLAFECQATLGEGPCWDVSHQELIWVDILESRIHRYSPASGKDAAWALASHVGCAVVTTAGNILAGTQKGFVRLERRTGEITPIQHPEADLPGNRFNDGKVDPSGRLWAGTMAYAETPGAGNLYRLDERYQAHKMISGVTISNGLAWTNDCLTMYYIDTPTLRVDAFDFDPETSSISNRRTVIRIPPGIGYPDGMSIDEEGMLWIGLWDGWGATRWNPKDGQLLARVKAPAARITSCCFGGNNLDELYLTSARVHLDEAALAKQPLAGSLFVTKPGVRGFAPFLFKEPH